MGAALIIVAVLVMGCAAVVWLLRRPDLPFRPRSHYDRRGFGRLTNPGDADPIELTEAIALLRSARRNLHDTLVAHHTSAAYPPILYESSSPLFVGSNSPHLYVFTESLEDGHPYWTKTLRTTPACTWTVQVGTGQTGRSQEERVSLTIDAESRPRLHASNNHRRYPGTPDGWSELIRDLAVSRP